jgi:hypothetical protein
MQDQVEDPVHGQLDNIWGSLDVANRLLLHVTERLEPVVLLEPGEGEHGRRHHTPGSTGQTHQGRGLGGY